MGDVSTGRIERPSCPGCGAAIRKGPRCPRCGTRLRTTTGRFGRTGAALSTLTSGEIRQRANGRARTDTNRGVRAVATTPASEQPEPSFAPSTRRAHPAVIRAALGEAHERAAMTPTPQRLDAARQRAIMERLGSFDGVIAPLLGQSRGDLPAHVDATPQRADKEAHSEEIAAPAESRDDAAAQVEPPSRAGQRRKPTRPKQGPVTRKSAPRMQVPRPAPAPVPMHTPAPVLVASLDDHADDGDVAPRRGVLLLACAGIAVVTVIAVWMVVG